MFMFVSCGNTPPEVGKEVVEAGWQCLIGCGQVVYTVKDGKQVAATKTNVN
jgi:hypothetical protein